LLVHILPELAHLAGDPLSFLRTMRRLDAVQQCAVLRYRGQLDVLLAALLCDIGLVETMPTGPQREPQSLAQAAARLARQRLEALKVTTIGVQLDCITALIAHSAFAVPALATPAALRHFAHAVGLITAFMLFDLRLADRLGNAPAQPLDDLLDLRQRLQTEIDRHAPLSLKGLAVNGHDLQRLGLPAGPRLGQILQTLLHHVLDDPGCNTRPYLLALARSEAGLPPLASAPPGSGLHDG
jgi:hypothetical protein